MRLISGGPTDSLSAPSGGTLLFPSVAIDDAESVSGVRIDGSASSSIVCPNVSKVNFERSVAFLNVLMAYGKEDVEIFF